MCSDVIYMYTHVFYVVLLSPLKTAEWSRYSAGLRVSPKSWTFRGFWNSDLEGQILVGKLSFCAELEMSDFGRSPTIFRLNRENSLKEAGQEATMILFKTLLSQSDFHEALMAIEKPIAQNRSGSRY